MGATVEGRAFPLFFPECQRGAEETIFSPPSIGFPLGLGMPDSDNLSLPPLSQRLSCARQLSLVPFPTLFFVAHFCGRRQLFPPLRILSAVLNPEVVWAPFSEQAPFFFARFLFFLAGCALFLPQGRAGASPSPLYQASPNERG